MKIGILGGTFNPPHLAHLRLAEEVAISYGLTRVVFIPCHIPPHKISVDIAPAADRLYMTSIACENNDLFEVSDIEIAASGPSYTVNTLETFSKKKDFEIFFIMGTDSLK
ncbi:MAG: nicotinate-nicotinamide nucleotide adenylyltransferase, partial [Desulfomonilaceae bacterium]